MEAVSIGISKAIEAGFEEGEEAGCTLANIALAGITAWSCGVLGALIANEADNEESD